MKKIISAILCTAITITLLSGMSTAGEKVTVELDGTQINFDVNPKIINGRAMVPLRSIFEEIGALVKWDTEIIISDNGMGISAEHLDKIWTRFYRIDDVRNDEYSSNGLGLAMVKSIIELHGGEIFVKSEYGKGTEFRIVLK